MNVLDDWLHARIDPCTCANGRECPNCRAWRSRQAKAVRMAAPPVDSTYLKMTRDLDVLRMRLRRLEMQRRRRGGGTAEIDLAQRAYHKLRNRRNAARAALKLACEAMDQSPSKICSRCGLISLTPSEDFPADAKRSDGLNGWCRRCYAERAATWYANNKGRTRTAS